MTTELETQQYPTSNLNASLTQNFGQRANLLQTMNNALIVTRREVRDSFRDWRIIAPIFLLTLVFPFLANIASALFTGLLESSSDFDNTDEVLEAFLPLMPMLVGFFPTSISLVIALETFVGEKERQSLEPLLSTPLTNLELYIGKVIAAILPPLSAGYLGIALYVGGQVLGAQQWRPELSLVVQILLLTTVQAIVMVTGAVVISSQTTSTRAANLLASAVIIPMSLLVIVESIVMIQPGLRWVLWWIALGLVVVIVLLMRTGTRIFRREELLGRAVDHINLGWAWQVIKDQWQGGVTDFNPLRWYRQSVFPAIGRLRYAMLTYLLCAVLAFIGGWMVRDTYPLPLDESTMGSETVLNNLRDIFEAGQSDPRFILWAIGQNLRVLALATVLAMLTFGVMGLVVTTLPFGILGYVMANISANGLDATPFVLAILPHGVIEIPAIMLAGAAALQLGTIITKPPTSMTVGEAWLRQLTDTVKIGVAVVLPMIVIAGILEVQLTPTVVEWAFTR